MRDRNRDSSVSIMTGYGLDGWSSSPDKEKITFFPRTVQTGSGAHRTSYPKGTAASFPKIKAKGREADHSPPYSANLYPHPPSYLHDVMLNWLSTGTTSHLKHKRWERKQSELNGGKKCFNFASYSYLRDLLFSSPIYLNLVTCSKIVSAIFIFNCLIIIIFVISRILLYITNFFVHVLYSYVSHVFYNAANFSSFLLNI
jgi:hypothetical protein